MTSIGIIGNGFVGQATARVWMEHADVKVFDVKPERSSHLLREVAACDFVMVCVPTPQGVGLECATGYVEGVLQELDTLKAQGHPVGVVVIRSTVPVGFTKQAQGKHPTLALLHSPEFLTARCHIADAHTPSRMIVGFPQKYEYGVPSVHGHALARLYEKRFPGATTFLMESTESELVKLCGNFFFAVKVWAFNEMHVLATALGVSWEMVRDGLLADGRIAHAHTQVPGPDGSRGFGGTCLPKDTASFAQCLADLGIQNDAIVAILKRNQEMRHGPQEQKSSVSSSSSFASQEPIDYGHGGPVIPSDFEEDSEG